MDFQLLVSQAPNGALSARRSSGAGATSFIPSSKLLHTPSSQTFLELSSQNRRKPLHLTLAAGGEPATSRRSPPFPAQDEDAVFVGEDGVPLEGVIQFDKPSTPSALLSWATLALLTGGDLLCFLAFSALGRFSHGLPIFDVETLKTADPFIAGWTLSAYFLGGYGEDGKGMNGYSTALAAAARSWLVGIPLGIVIRAATSSHIPQTNFILIAMASTGILLLGWRALACKLLSLKSSKNDVYKRGSPFELFELLTSLVRRW
ncbi:uncharacterized protein LOC110032942 [Phalaenopsis equestris]|uniref:uncharacterized protein LOC110032942 n=1 Tax=Phalaenopsis equestris TaxID=78828 RepID=UPI0009E3FA3F|nr:uncharacterized protein LOC110032942 [Phalaenopsis equestris]